MPTQYKLGDKTFQSTGDPAKDIEIIKQNFPEVDTTALQQSLSGKGPEISENKNSYLQNLLQHGKKLAIDALQGGALETAGTMGGGALGGSLGSAASGVGAIPGGIAGASAGAAIGKNLEDAILNYIGIKPSQSALSEAGDVLGAAARGATAEMAGQGSGKILEKTGETLLNPVANFLTDKVAPRLMTSAVKDPDLAAEMLKRNEWGSANSLAEKAQGNVEDLSGKIDSILSKIKGKVDRLKIVDQLEELRKQYARLPGRENEVAAIEDLQQKVFQSPTKSEVAKGTTDYANLKPSQANNLKRDIYSENKKLYQGGNYDPASIRAQTDMATARGLKEGIEAAAPQVKDINSELGHNIELRDVMQRLQDKASKASLLELKPLLAGLGLVSHGAIPAAMAPTGISFLGSTVGGTGAAVAANKVGQSLATRSGTPISGFLARLLTQRGLRP